MTSPEWWTLLPPALGHQTSHASRYDAARRTQHHFWGSLAKSAEAESRHQPKLRDILQSHFKNITVMKCRGPCAGWKRISRHEVANFYSLKTETIPIGMVALGDGLGCYRVGILLNMGSGNWAGLDLEAHGNSCYGAWSVPEIFVLWLWYLWPRYRTLHEI